jgi:hypothetical protein
MAAPSVVPAAPTAAPDMAVCAWAVHDAWLTSDARVLVLLRCALDERVPPGPGAFGGTGAVCGVLFEAGGAACVLAASAALPPHRHLVSLAPHAWHSRLDAAWAVRAALLAALPASLVAVDPAAVASRALAWAHDSDAVLQTALRALARRALVGDGRVGAVAAGADDVAACGGAPAGAVARWTTDAVAVRVRAGGLPRLGDDEDGWAVLACLHAERVEPPWARQCVVVASDSVAWWAAPDGPLALPVAGVPPHWEKGAVRRAAHAAGALGRADAGALALTRDGRVLVTHAPLSFRARLGDDAAGAAVPWTPSADGADAAVAHDEAVRAHARAEAVRASVAELRGEWHPAVQARRAREAAEREEARCRAARVATATAGAAAAFLRTAGVAVQAAAVQRRSEALVGE